MCRHYAHRRLKPALARLLVCRLTRSAGSLARRTAVFEAVYPPCLRRLSWSLLASLPACLPACWLACLLACMLLCDCSHARNSYLCNVSRVVGASQQESCSQLIHMLVCQRACVFVYCVCTCMYIHVCMYVSVVCALCPAPPFVRVGPGSRCRGLRARVCACVCVRV